MPPVGGGSGAGHDSTRRITGSCSSGRRNAGGFSLELEAVHNGGGAPPYGQTPSSTPACIRSGAPTSTVTRSGGTWSWLARVIRRSPAAPSQAQQPAGHAVGKRSPSRSTGRHRAREPARSWPTTASFDRQRGVPTGGVDEAGVVRRAPRAGKVPDASTPPVGTPRCRSKIAVVGRTLPVTRSMPAWWTCLASAPNGVTGQVVVLAKALLASAGSPAPTRTRSP